MRLLRLINPTWIGLSLFVILGFFTMNVAAEETLALQNHIAMDRIQLVTQQINLLQNRLKQGQQALLELKQQQNQPFSTFSFEKGSKSLLDKAALDVSVSKTNAESIDIELTDADQTILWLEKRIQEIENQLNILSIFGIKITKEDAINFQSLRSDLIYQQKLLGLENTRIKCLQDLQTVMDNILSMRKENYNRINTLFKSRKLLSIKQTQVTDELAYQKEQHAWLQQLDQLYKRLAIVDPIKSHPAYAALERDIYYANEKANNAYVQSLIARYNDQIQQMKLAILKSNSISVLNEISDQVQVINKQITRLDEVLKARSHTLETHITHLTARKGRMIEFQPYLKKLTALEKEYKASEFVIANINTNLSDFRTGLDQALQTELSSRQGFPTFGLSMLLDLGKEVLLVPALAFQMMKSLSTSLLKAIEATTIFSWTLFAIAEVGLMTAFIFLRKMLTQLFTRQSVPEQLNSKWILLRLLQRHFIDFVVIANVVGVMLFFNIPPQHYIFILYLSLVWLSFKGFMLVSRLCLVETTHDTSGHDMRLYRRLKWMIWIGGCLTALTVFVHQLPLIYELKSLCDRLFLLLMMGVSILLLRSWHVVPNLILSQMEEHHPYLGKSIRLIGVLIPLLILGNSIIGVFGFLNLIMTVSWYEGVFLIVLIGYLLLRGLLSDAMEQISRLMIQYVHNGWLWTEAFLKPLDKVLRITLFLSAWAVLFILYGWDKQSPIVERLTRLLHYQLANVLHTTITPISIIELFVVISIFYWTAKWTREFVYRLLFSRTKDMGIRNSIAILSQYCVVLLGAFLCLRVLGIDLQTLTMVASVFAFGIGLGLRDLANNFACGFLILIERPLRVGDIVNICGIEGDVMHIGGRAITVRTWDHMELIVPNAEIFNKSFTNWTAKNNIIRSVFQIKISRYDNPHEVKVIIQDVLATQKDILKEPTAEVYLKNMNDTLMEFEVRYYVNIRNIKSRTSVMSTVLMNIWDTFAQHGIKPPYPQQEILIRTGELPHFQSTNQTESVIEVS